MEHGVAVEVWRVHNLFGINNPFFFKHAMSALPYDTRIEDIFIDRVGNIPEMRLY